MSSTATQYAYKVRDQQGKLTEGKVEAVSEAAVAEKLLAMGYVPLEVKQANVGMQREINIGPKKRVKTKDLAVFSRQFATMIDAGLTMIRALSIMADQSENPELRRILRSVKGDVEAGLSLSAAFAKFPASFPPLMINMTKAGEAGGFLDGAMRQIADNFEAEVKLRAKIKAALTYPVVVFCLAILMCIAMLIFVVPTFKNMFADLGGTLPLPTRILVFLSSAMKFLLPVGIVLLVAFVAWWRKFGRTEKVRNVVDPLKLRIPVFGNLFQKLALTRFSRNLGTLLSSGVPILQSLDIVSETTGSIVISRALPAGAGVRTPRRVGRRPAGRARGLPADGRADDRLRRGGRRHRPDAEEDRGVLRRGGRDDDRVADRAHRAADDRLPRRGRRVDDRRALPADLQGLRPDRLTPPADLTGSPTAPRIGRARLAVNTPESLRCARVRGEPTSHGSRLGPARHFNTRRPRLPATDAMLCELISSPNGHIPISRT